MSEKEPMRAMPTGAIRIWTPDEGRGDSVYAVFILAMFVVFQLGSMSGAAAAAMAALAIAAILLSAAVLRLSSHVVKTENGLALVRTRRAPDGSRIRVLQQGGVYQSATYVDERRFDPVFAYQRAFDAVFDAEGRMFVASGHGISRVLALGGGGYAWPKHALMRRARLQMEVVEIDPAIICAAWRWFFVGELKRRAGERLQLIVADGRVFLDRSGASYDVIVNDTFAGREPVRSLSTVEAVRAARDRLTPGGIYAVNVVSASDGTDLSFLRDTVATLVEVFAHVHVIPATDEAFGGEDNYLVIATDGDYAFDGAIPFDRDFLGEVLHD